jgi:hypothetical protein
MRSLAISGLATVRHLMIPILTDSSEQNLAPSSHTGRKLSAERIGISAGSRGTDRVLEAMAI